LGFLMTSLRRTRTRPSPSGRRALLVGLLLTGSLTLLAGPAQAHDELISTNPADKARIATLPSQVVLTFEEPPAKTGTQVLVTGPGGNAATGPPILSGDDVTQAIAPGSPAGTYTVTWRITADDGHAVFGKFAFTAAAGNAPAPSSANAASTPSSSAVGTHSPAKPSSNKGVGLLFLVLLVIPAALFVRRSAARARELSER
jgi:methionine-rich copper-binding protein CopC